VIAVLLFLSVTHTTDCIGCVEDEVFVSKSVDGKIAIWQAGVADVRTIKVPNCSSTKIRFAISRDRQFLCVGSEVGVLFIFEIKTGRVVNRLKYKRIKTAIQDCAFSRDCSHIIFVGYEPFIWRWSYAENNPQDAENNPQDAEKKESKDKQKEDDSDNDE